MNYDPDKIKVEHIEINGKKVPVYKIPTGMVGPNATKLAEVSYNDNEDQSKEQFKINKSNNKIYDEENVGIEDDDYLDL